MGLEFDTEKGDDLETIRHRLAEAIAWFEFAGGLSDSGFPRSDNLHPTHLNTERKWLVEAVAHSRRRNIVANHGTVGGRIEGRLLGYAPDESLFDGASEDVTTGFFDWNNEPPWDLWLGYVVETGGREYLVSWIPPICVKTAEDGIEVNPEECIFWLEDLEHALGLGLSTA